MRGKELRGGSWAASQELKAKSRKTKKTKEKAGGDSTWIKQDKGLAKGSL
jgi:hypothetical protein